jgi:hypothetical protein
MVTITDTRVVGDPKEKVAVGLTLRTSNGREYSVLHGDANVISAMGKKGDPKLWELCEDPPYKMPRFESFEELCSYLTGIEEV